MSPMRLFSLVLIICAALGATACGGSDTADRKLIAQSRSDALVRAVDRVGTDIADGDCSGAGDGIDSLRELVEKLPEATDGPLVSNVTQWVDHLEGRISEDCQVTSEEPTATPSATQTPEESATPTPSATPTETATPSPSPSPSPDATATPAPTAAPTDPAAPDTGGAAPEGDG